MFGCGVAYSRHRVSHIGQLPCGMGFTHSSFTLRNGALSVPRFIRQLRNTDPLRTCGNIIAGNRCGNRLPDSELLATVPAASFSRFASRGGVWTRANICQPCTHHHNFVELVHLYLGEHM